MTAVLQTGWSRHKVMTAVPQTGWSRHKVMTAVPQTGWSRHKVMTAVPRFGRKRFFANSPQNEPCATETRVEWKVSNGGCAPFKI